MGIFGSFRRNKEKKVIVFAPAEGVVIPLAELNDGVFSAEILGGGCGIVPQSGIITAPFDGTVVQAPDSKHALCLESRDGVELLIHVGLETVALDGQGFDVRVGSGQVVCRGDELMTFDKAQIENAGYCTTVICVVTNTEAFQNMVLCEGQGVNRDSHLIEMERKN